MHQPDRPAALEQGLSEPQVRALRELTAQALSLPLGTPTADTFVLLRLLVLSYTTGGPSRHLNAVLDPPRTPRPPPAQGPPTRQ